MGWAPRQVAAFVAACLFVSVMPAVAGASVAVKQPAAPKEWDERVQPLVDFIEDERGLEFKHPAKVEFLSDNAFRKRVRIKVIDRTKKARELADQSEGQLRALGLIEGDIDLLEALTDLGEAGIVGFYDPEEKTLAIRGVEIADVRTRVTVVHELTHALQDQHFGLVQLQDKAEAKGSGAASVLRALVEGDAVVVHSAYLETLPPSEQDQILGTGGTPTPPVGEPLPEGVPPVLETFLLAPYVLGAPFVYGLDAQDGSEGRDRAFRNPPRSEEQLIDPVAWKQRQRPVKVAAPKLHRGEKGHGKADDFGVITLYLILGSRLDVGTALAAVTGWSGDSYRAYRSEGRECLRAAFAMDTPKDRDELEAALQSWTPGSLGGATVRRRGDEIELTTCEVEGVVTPPQAVIDAAMEVLANRVAVAVSLAAEGDVALERVVCLADHLVVNPTIIDILTRLGTEGIAPSELSLSEQKQLTDGTQDAARACNVSLRGR